MVVVAVAVVRLELELAVVEAATHQQEVPLVYQQG
jgi:hypothetical protein